MARAIVNAHDLLIETRIIKEYLKVQVTGDLKKGVIALCYFWTACFSLAFISQTEPNSYKEVEKRWILYRTCKKSSNNWKKWSMVISP